MRFLAVSSSNCFFTTRLETALSHKTRPSSEPQSIYFHKGKGASLKVEIITVHKEKIMWGEEKWKENLKGEMVHTAKDKPPWCSSIAFDYNILELS